MASANMIARLEGEIRMVKWALGLLVAIGIAILGFLLAQPWN
ncbi:MAG: hypothetical protein OXM02_08200 [Bacteroidota bacterium]|nr:hypothetical protein [Bacteroidota bacterium]MDE2834490.1 hypothetical protein [Bacteroidota bacterium]MDE2957932.1 hypothetical protein [Bacteroidota bacterium]